MAVDVKPVGSKFDHTKKLFNSDNEVPRRARHRPTASSLPGVTEEPHTATEDSAATSAFHQAPPPPRSPTPVFTETDPAKIGLTQLPAEKERMCKRKGGRLSLILAGTSGTGKTTFLNTLFGEVLEDPTSAQTASEIREQKFLLTEAGFDLRLTVVDCPGFGTKIDNQYSWMPLVKYIDYHFKQYMMQEEQPDRRCIQDNRVHVCLYFLQPSNTQLSPLDVESMKEISRRVNLIPLLARSDTLNKDELLDFKQKVNHTLADHGIEICRFMCDENVLAEIKRMAPYAVVGCNNLQENASGNLVRARKYNWGMVEIENPDHCDFLALRDVLMSRHMLDLILSTEGHYNEYRQRSLRERMQRATRHHVHTFDDSETSGLASYKWYKNQMPLSNVVTDAGRSPEEDVLEEESKKAFEMMVRQQEIRFREWKARLLEKQDSYNDDLKAAFLRVHELREEVALMGCDDDLLAALEEAAEAEEMEDRGRAR